MTAPAAIGTWSWGRLTTRAGGPILRDGGSALDAIEAGIRAVELDPGVVTVGDGGLPNAEGIVELDAMIMDGASLEVGAVAALRRFPTPIAVARRVMERSRHAFLVGEGAAAFASAHGFEERDVLSDAARARWERWRADPERGRVRAHDTVGMVALDARGRLAAGCSTSGLPFKEPGRVGDSPLVGAGAYCDGRVGGAAATGEGDVLLRFCPSFAVVEAMRAGRPPREACEEVLERMLGHGVGAEAALIALDRDGRFGAAVIGRDDFPHAVWSAEVDELRRAPRLAADR